MMMTWLADAVRQGGAKVVETNGCRVCGGPVSGSAKRPAEEFVHDLCARAGAGTAT